MNHQSTFNTRYRMLGAGARGWSKEMICGGRWEGASGLVTDVQPFMWLIHVNVWQNQYSIVKQNKVKIKIKKKKLNGLKQYKVFILQFCSSEVWRGSYWVKVKVSVELSLRFSSGSWLLKFYVSSFFIVITLDTFI